MASALLAEGVELIAGGTENHLMVVDTVRSFGLDGQQAQEALDRARITANKQVVPDDTRPPMRPSGLRLGTPACATRGMGRAEMETIAGWIVRILRHPDDDGLAGMIAKQVVDLCRGFPVPGAGLEPVTAELTT
jgi:glycine hydroxymethyltransferase